MLVALVFVSVLAFRGDYCGRLGMRMSEVPSEPIQAPRPISRKYKTKRPQATRVIGAKRTQLRIFAGTARGRKLESPSTLLRPMMGKVREALFSTLTSLGVLRPPRRVAVLDCYCGSGSVGMEALSRGADFACFVDLSRDACDAAQRNAEICGFASRALTLCESAEVALARPAIENRRFDVVTLTPPYEEVSYADILDRVAASNLLNDDAVIVVEYPVELGTLPPQLGDHLIGLRNRRYGRTVLAFYAHRPTGKLAFDFRPDEFLA